MTVAQLIEMLKKMPADSRVVVSVRDGETVRQVELASSTMGLVVLR